MAKWLGSSVGTEWCRWMRLIDLKSVPFSFIRNCFLLIPRVIKLAIATGVEIIHLFSSCFSTAAFNDDTFSSLFGFPNDQRAGSPDTGMSTRRREPERAESSWLTQSTSCALLIDRNCGPSIMCCPPRRLKLLSLIHVLIDHVIHILDLRLCFRDRHNWAESGSLGNSKFRSVHSSLFHYYELRAKNNLLSHHFSRALSDFPLLSQILAQ